MIEPLTLSWSQIRTFEECHQKLHLIRNGHRSPAQNLRNFYHGMVVDWLMRNWLADPHRRPGQMAARVTDAIEVGQQEALSTGDGVVRWKHSEDKAELHQFCTELVTRLEPILRDLVLPYAFESGTRFKTPITIPYLDGTPTTVYLIGEMDLLITKPSGDQIVYDLKGTKDDTYWRKVLGQLFFYDLAVYAMTGKPTVCTALIQPMCAERVKYATVSDADRRQMYARILRLAHGIWAHTDDCKQGTTGCAYCEVRHACRRYTSGDALSLGSALRAAALEITG